MAASGGANTAALAAQTRSERVALVLIREWKSDTYMGTSLTYDLALSVVDAAGTPLADKSDRGKRDLGASAWNPPAHARKAAPEMFSKMMGEFLSDEGILKALK